MPRHKLTAEERAKGGRAKAEKIHAEREAARAEAEERLAGLTSKALDVLVELLDSDDDQVRARGVAQVLDRVVGRPAQALKIRAVEGTVEVKLGFDPGD